MDHPQNGATSHARKRRTEASTVTRTPESLIKELQSRNRKEDGAIALDDIETYLRRFIAYPSNAACIAHTLWIAHTHQMDIWESTPRIAFLSPEPASGKTRALEITETLVPRPVEAVNVTSAYIFRKVSSSDGPPTILHDEIDTVFGVRAREHEDIRGLINAGHRRGAMAGRCVVSKNVVETVDFPAYCAVALAGLGELPDTILTRSIVIRMRRRASNEKVEPYRRRIHAAEGNQLRDDLSAWMNGANITWPDMPDEIEDRNADVWEPLIATADAAGSNWPQQARAAAVALVADSRESTPSLGVRLLGDVKTIFGGDDALHTRTLIDRLVRLDEAPWGNLRGTVITARFVSKQLKPYGIAAKDVRVGSVVTRGYTKESFYEAWRRYVPDPLSVSSEEPATCATSATNTKIGDFANDLDEATDTTYPSPSISSSDNEVNR